MFAIFLLAGCVASATSMTSLAGFGFAAGAIAAAGTVRRRDLLLTMTMPPVIFLVALVCATVLTAPPGRAGSSSSGIAAGVLLLLAANAPWLFGGMAGAFVIAVVRGLGQCVRDLRAGLAGAAPPADARDDRARARAGRQLRSRSSIRYNYYK